MSCFQKILSLSPAHPEAMAIPRPDFAAEVPGEKSLTDFSRWVFPKMSEGSNGVVSLNS